MIAFVFLKKIDLLFERVKKKRKKEIGGDAMWGVRCD